MFWFFRICYVFDCFREPRVALVRSEFGCPAVRSLWAFLNTYYCYKVNVHGVSGCGGHRIRLSHALLPGNRRTRLNFGPGRVSLCL